MLTFTQIELIDLFFRFAAVGSLFFIGCFGLDKSASVPLNQSRLWLWLSRSLLLCLSGYLFLTAPIDDSVYGHFRGLFLLLTELLPYCLWLYVFVLIKPEVRIENMHWSLKLIAVCLFLWFVYFFAVLQGRGGFHQLNHVLGIVLYCHIAIMAIYNLQDDLVQQRRTTRVAMVIFFGAYSSFLAVLEILDFSLKDKPLFGVMNSSTIFFMIMLFKILIENAKNLSDQITVDLPELEPLETTNGPINKTIPIIFKTDLEKIEKLMDQDFYTQSNLTIGVLAGALGMPEHRLRLLINNHLAYQNFSAFLNSYRIPAAINILQDSEHSRLPILSIALQLGFGSIGPFNRAFKQMTGLTPSEHRKKFQNQP